jgi:hypothetical protein
VERMKELPPPDPAEEFLRELSELGEGAFG